VAQVVVGPEVVNTNTFKITSIAAGKPVDGCAAVTISFTGQATLPAGQSYGLVGSPTLSNTNGYAPVADSTLNSLGSGAYQFVFTNCSAECFYKISLVNSN